jgi:hypothetical protein
MKLGARSAAEREGEFQGNLSVDKRAPAHNLPPS